MKAAIRFAALTLLLMPVMVSAQEPQPQHPLAGHWRGPMVEGAGEDAEVVVELRIEGDAVTGPIATSKVGDLYIRNGSATANSVQFTSPSLDPQAQGGSLVWSGQLTGTNELAFSVVPEGGGPEQTFTLTKRQPVPGGRH